MSQDIDFQSLAQGPIEGSFGRYELPGVLIRAVREGRTGRLTIADGGNERTVGLAAGLPTLAGSQVASEHFGQRLAKLNLITPDDLARIDSLMVREPIQFGAAMVRLDIVGTAELRRLLTTHHSWIIGQCLGATRAEVSFAPFVWVAKDPSSVALVQAIEDGVRAYGRDEIDELWAQAEGWRFIATDEDLALVRRLGCARPVADLLDRSRASWRTAAQLATACEDSDPRVMVLALALAGLWRVERPSKLATSGAGQQEGDAAAGAGAAAAAGTSERTGGPAHTDAAGAAGSDAGSGPTGGETAAGASAGSYGPWSGAGTPPVGISNAGAASDAHEQSTGPAAGGFSGDAAAAGFRSGAGTPPEGISQGAAAGFWTGAGTPPGGIPVGGAGSSSAPGGTSAAVSAAPSPAPGPGVPFGPWSSPAGGSWSPAPSSASWPGAASSGPPSSHPGAPHAGFAPGSADSGGAGVPQTGWAHASGGAATAPHPGFAHASGGAATAPHPGFAHASSAAASASAPRVGSPATPRDAHVTGPAHAHVVPPVETHFRPQPATVVLTAAKLERSARRVTLDFGRAVFASRFFRTKLGIVTVGMTSGALVALVMSLLMRPGQLPYGLHRAAVVEEPSEPALLANPPQRSADAAASQGRGGARLARAEVSSVGGAREDGPSSGEAAAGSPDQGDTTGELAAAHDAAPGQVVAAAASSSGPEVTAAASTKVPVPPAASTKAPAPDKHARPRSSATARPVTPAAAQAAAEPQPASAPARAVAGGPDAEQVMQECRRATQASDFRRAASACQAVLMSDPRNALAYRFLGVAYTKLGAKAQACESFRRYLRFSPSAPDRPQIEAWLRGC